ncbi:MAG: catalase family protein [Gammaproteobacteria bacterium]|nr:catalase family protein [Gammaproteobacteria bacterium]
MKISITVLAATSAAAASLLVGSAASAAEATPEPSARSNPATGGPAPTPFETVPADESAQISEITDLMVQLLRQRYGDNLARRGVHPKDHGCVKAQLTVDADLPERLRVGVFAKPGKQYDAWVRFSNATGTVTADVAPNGANSSRGMAIKLMGVEGSTLLNEPGGKTQDFLLINQPMFAFANVAEYLDVTRLQVQHRDDGTKVFPALFANMTPEKAATAKIVKFIAQTRIGNPLESRYFSAAPFLFGKNEVVKFAVMPRVMGATPFPMNPAPNYLREALKKSLDPLSGKPAVFDFQVQSRSTDSLPIENASAEWSEDTAPYQTVATLTIPPQDFDNPMRITECEHLVFTPWHALAEHRPLGGINRLRLGVYQASAVYRGQSREPSRFPE